MIREQHRLTDTPEYSTWTDIKTRCGNPGSKDFHRYGGRGITVCARWFTSFEAFFQDMGPRPSNLHSIERNDSDGNYEPGNCRWATKREQARNRSTNHPIAINGVTKLISDWAAEVGISRSAMTLRVQSGLTGADLLAPPDRGGNLSFNGHTDTHAGWSKRTGIKSSTIAMRITKYGWSVEKALTQGAKL